MDVQMQKGSLLFLFKRLPFGLLVRACRVFLLGLCTLSVAVAADITASISAASATVRLSGTSTDSSGNVYVAGFWQGSSTLVVGGTTLTMLSSTADLFAAKFTASGSLIWAKNFGGNAGFTTLSVPAIVPDSNGNALVISDYNSNLTTPALTKIGSNDGLVLKLASATGNVVWSKQIGGAGANARAITVAVDSADNVLVAGFGNTANFTSPALTLIGGSLDAFVIKLDSSGADVWAKSFGGAGASIGSTALMKLKTDSNNNVYFASQFTGANLTTPALTKIGSSDGMVLKLASATGNTTWSKNFGGTGATAVLSGLGLDSGGNVWVGGYFSGANLTTPALTRKGTQDLLLLKLASTDGTTSQSFNFGNTSLTATASALVLDNKDNLLLAGDFSGANFTQPALTRIGTKDAYVLQVSSAGDVVLGRNYGGTGASVTTRALARAGDGTISVVGDFTTASLTTPALTKVGTQDGFRLSREDFIPQTSVFVPPVVVPFVVATPTDKPQQVVKDPFTVLTNVPAGTKVSDNGVLVLRTPSDGETNPIANISTSTPQNTILQLPPTVPTTFTLGGQTLVFTPGKDTPVPVQVQTKTIQFTDGKGVAQTGQALQVIQGTATLSGPAGLPVSAFAGTTTDGCEQNVGYITPVLNGTTVNANATNTSFLLLGRVDAGAVVVTFSSCIPKAKQNTFAANGFAAAQQAFVFRGEQLYLDKLGQLDRIVVRSSSGTAGDAGDPIKLTGLTGFGFSPSLAVPQLAKDTGRLPANSSLQARLSVVALAQFPDLQNASWTFTGQDSLGTLRFARADQEVMMIPVGEVRIASSAPDGVSFAVSSQGIITANETTTVVSAMPRNVARLVSDMRTLDAGATFQLVDDGTLRLSFKGVVYGVQPDWSATFNTSFQSLSAFGQDSAGSRGICHYADGWKQCYYPVVNDFGNLSAAIKRIDSAATVASDRKGVVTVNRAGKIFDLLPDFTVLPTPASRAKDDYWFESGRFFVKNPNGVSQGFDIRCPIGMSSAPFC